MSGPEPGAARACASSDRRDLSVLVAEEALAVFELIDDLRDKILELHGDRLREALKDQRGHAGSDESGDAADDDRPF